MLFFGYIVTDIVYKDIKEDIVKVVSSLDECTMPLPKLIIGLDNAKAYAKSHGWKFDILEHIFPNNDMWTFKKTEKRDFYEEDIASFKKKIVTMQGSNLTYHYINLYTLPYNKIKKLYHILFNNALGKESNYIIIDKDMLYMSLNESNVMGISFGQLRYIGIDREKIINKLKACQTNKIYYTTPKKMWQLKEWFRGREYVISHIFDQNAQKKEIRKYL